jgi:hypothetical protein
MVFDTDEAAVYRIRPQHRNEEVRELVPGRLRRDAGDGPGASYEAEELRAVNRQKCLSHLLRNIKEVVETKRGRAREFGLGVGWEGPYTEAFAQEGKRIDAALTHQLRIRRLIDPDNQRLLDGIGLHSLVFRCDPPAAWRVAPPYLSSPQ